MAPMYVVKRDGQSQEVKFDAITRRIQTLCDGLDSRFVDPVPVTQKVVEGFYNGISTSEVDTLAAETCAYMSQKHPDFSTLAARIAVSNLHKNTSSSFYETCKILHSYVDKQGRPAALLADDVWEFICANQGALDQAIDYKRDLGYDYFGFKTLEKSYLLRMHGKIVERPQHMIMRAACGIHLGGPVGRIGDVRLDVAEVLYACDTDPLQRRYPQAADVILFPAEDAGGQHRRNLRHPEPRFVFRIAFYLL